MNLLTCWEYLLGQFKSIQNDNLNVSHCHQICTPPADRGAEYLAKSDNYHRLSLFTIFSIVLLLSPALRRTLNGEDLTLPQFKQNFGFNFPSFKQSMSWDAWTGDKINVQRILLWNDQHGLTGKCLCGNSDQKLPYHATNLILYFRGVSPSATRHRNVTHWTLKFHRPPLAGRRRQVTSKYHTMKIWVPRTDTRWQEKPVHRIQSHGCSDDVTETANACCFTSSICFLLYYWYTRWVQLTATLMLCELVTLSCCYAVSRTEHAVATRASSPATIRTAATNLTAKCVTICLACTGCQETHARACTHTHLTHIIQISTLNMCTTKEV